MQTPRWRPCLVAPVKRYWQRLAWRHWTVRIRWWAERALEKVAEGG